jgi:hypothetical protein
MRLVASHDSEALGERRARPAPRRACRAEAGERRCVLITAPLSYRPPSADLLLTSLSLAARPCAVAVVLSEAGTTGATVVHDFGEKVIAAEAEVVDPIRNAGGNDRPGQRTGSRADIDAIPDSSRPWSPPVS